MQRFSMRSYTIFLPKRKKLSPEKRVFAQAKHPHGFSCDLDRKYLPHEHKFAIDKANNRFPQFIGKFVVPYRLNFSEMILDKQWWNLYKKELSKLGGKNVGSHLSA